jgi:hypothetical protein
MNVREAWKSNEISINEELECKYQSLSYNTKLIYVDGDWLYDVTGDLFEGIFLLDVDCGVILCPLEESEIFEIVEKEELK